MVQTKAQTNPSISCTFTDDACGWYSDNEVQFNWARKEATFSFNNTGPYVDHTNFANGLTSGGWLMSIETASHNPQDKGIKLLFFLNIYFFLLQLLKF